MSLLNKSGYQIYQLGFYHVGCFYYLFEDLAVLSFHRRAELLIASTKETFPILLGTVSPHCCFSDVKRKKIKVLAVIVTQRYRLPGWREGNLDTQAALQ